ncbi:MAG: hypothetical protein AB7S86_16605 [Hydrogenophaga sp.]|uniref:hypothetical protein n=1 Tax=Hydrogenophaga sp. TaxID=1904254 RepID=UPI003D0C2C14
MSRSRQRIADFEARSVQLIAACTLGLAGVASLPNATLSRITGQASTHTTAPSKTSFNEAPRLLPRRPRT